ncbi:unnamed protein product, partial [Prorocentrum cordatum]
EYKTKSGVVCNKKLILGGAHLIEAFYIALKQHPNAPQLHASLVEGVPDCTRVDARTPSDGLKYFVDISNELNGFASRTSFLQMYRRVEDIVKGYANHLKREKQQQQQHQQQRKLAAAAATFEGALAGGEGGEPDAADQKPADADSSKRKADDAADNAGGEQPASKKLRSQAGYETEYLNWMKKAFPNTFTHMTVFKAARAFKAKMVELKQWEPFADYMEAHVKFTETFGQGNVIHCQAAVLYAFAAEAERPDIMTESLVPALRLCAPTNDGVPQVCFSVRNTTVKLFSGFVDVRMSKCAEAVAKAKASGKTKKGAAKAKAMGKVGDKAVAAMPLPPAASKTTFWGDALNVIAMVTKDAKRVLAEVVEGAKCCVIMQIVQHECTLPVRNEGDVQVKGWTKFRTALARFVIAQHEYNDGVNLYFEKFKDTGSAGEQGIDDASSTIAVMGPVPETFHEGMAVTLRDYLEKDPVDISTWDEAGDSSKVLGKDSSIAVARVVSASKGAWASKSHIWSPAMAEAVEPAADVDACVSEVLNQVWLAVEGLQPSAVCKVLSKFVELPKADNFEDLSALADVHPVFCQPLKYFKSCADAVVYLNFRSRFAMSLIDESCSAMQDMIQKKQGKPSALENTVAYLKKGLSFVRANTEKVAVSDFRLADDSSWKSLWARLMKKANEEAPKESAAQREKPSQHCGVDLESMTAKDLKGLASHFSIAFESSIKKAELVKLISDKKATIAAADESLQQSGPNVDGWWERLAGEFTSGVDVIERALAEADEKLTIGECYFPSAAPSASGLKALGTVAFAMNATLSMIDDIKAHRETNVEWMSFKADANNNGQVARPVKFLGPSKAELEADPTILTKLPSCRLLMRGRVTAIPAGTSAGLSKFYVGKALGGYNLVVTPLSPNQDIGWSMKVVTGEDCLPTMVVDDESSYDIVTKDPDGTDCAIKVITLMPNPEWIASLANRVRNDESADSARD